MEGYFIYAIAKSKKIRSDMFNEERKACKYGLSELWDFAVADRVDGIARARDRYSLKYICPYVHMHPISIVDLVLIAR